ncbi:hypothetical protein ACA910_012661 [Epithemia clementina (nom. ined.)]
MDPPPTLNSNPVVLEVSNEPHHRRNALEWAELAAISGLSPISDQNGNNEFADFFLKNNNSLQQATHRLKRSPEDAAVWNALSGASIYSHGKGVSLLRNLGLYYPVDESQRRRNNHQGSIRQPLNHFSSIWSVPLPPGVLQQKTAAEDNDDDNSDNSNGKIVDTMGKLREAITADEVFDIVRNIQDPEHPLTLEQLGVVSAAQVTVVDRPDGPFSTVDVRFTPTIPHCSMATQIGLCLKVKLDRSLPRFKIKVRIEPGTHASEKAINKQLADKERVCAALENKHLLAIVNKCILDGMTNHMT